MKIKSFNIAPVILVAVLLAGCGPEGYRIKGNIAGDSENKTVYINYGDFTDSTVIKDGKFEFTGLMETPELVTLTLYPDDFRGRFRDNRYVQLPVIPLFIGNEKVTVTASFDEIPLDSFDGIYDYSKIKVTGSPTHDLYVQYKAGIGQYVKARGDAFDKYIAYLNPPKGTKKGPVSEGIAAVDMIDAATDQTKDYVKKFVAAHKDNVVGAYALMDNLERFSAGEIDALLATLTPSLLNSPYGERLAQRADEVKRSAIGSPFIDLELEDNNGNPVKLSDYLGKGRYVLVEFWASWCGPCRADIPHLKDVYELYHPEGFDIVGVSMDDNKENWLKAIGEEGLEWPQVSDLKGFSGQIGKLYNFSGIPHCVLIGPDGTIVNRNMRGSWMDRELIKMYGNKF